MAPFMEEPSYSAPLDERIIYNAESPKVELKRKRGYYPYTEDDDSSLWEIKTPIVPPSQGILRVFEDSIPWYQWKRKSFATPEERVKAFQPPDSEPESEDEFLDAPGSTTQNSEARIPETSSIAPGVDLYKNCFGIVDLSIVSEVEKFKTVPRLSNLEERLETGLYLFVEQVKSGFEEMQSGVTWIYKRTCQLFHDKMSEEPTVKRQKQDTEIAVIPPNAYWPPIQKRPLPTKTVTVARKGRDSIPKELKFTSKYQRHVNAMFDGFVAQRNSLGFCTCKCRPPFPNLPTNCPQSPIPGTYPISVDGNEMHDDTTSVLLSRRSCLRLARQTPPTKTTVKSEDPAKTKAIPMKDSQQKLDIRKKSSTTTSRVRKDAASQSQLNRKVGAKRGLKKQARKGPRMRLKRSYKSTPMPDVYYL